MDRIAHYRQLLKTILGQYHQILLKRPKPDKEVELVFDDERGHYMLVNIGWADKQRVRGNIFYIRLRDGKFWIEEDWTDRGIVTDLLEAGVPKEDIVLAFQHPSMRPHTEFAMA